MHVIEQGLPALVYKADEQKDLALLKLQSLPEDIHPLPYLKLAEDAPKPGTDCIVLGHPAAGMLWTVREGTVIGVGTWPKDMIDVMMQRLAASGPARTRIETACREAMKRKVLISSCGLNGGDSGGPLLNDQGQLIAVSFAIPARATPDGPDLDKFSYHVHLDEVKEFLATKPNSPASAIPDPWPAAEGVALVDFNGNSVDDTLVFFTGKNEPLVGMVCDLDEDSEMKPAGFQSPRHRREHWDFEFALHQLPHRQAFYDRDNDGQIDLCLVDADRDGSPEQEFSFEKSRWRLTESRRAVLVDPSLFEAQDLRDKLTEALQKMAVHTSAEGEERALNKMP